MPSSSGGVGATAERQAVTHSMLKQTNTRLDQFETVLDAIADKLGVSSVSPSRYGSPSKGAEPSSDLALMPSTPSVLRSSPGKSPGSSSRLSPTSHFARQLTEEGNMNNRVRANLVKVYGRNRQLLMEAETIILWAALHWSHYHLSFTFCTWRGWTHGGMLREILATRAALHWRMAEAARAFNTWNYTAITMMIQQEAMTKAWNRMKETKLVSAFNTWRWGKPCPLLPSLLPSLVTPCSFDLV